MSVHVGLVVRAGVFLHSVIGRGVLSPTPTPAMYMSTLGVVCSRNG